MYRYYLTKRPIDIGTFPTEGAIVNENVFRNLSSNLEKDSYEVSYSSPLTWKKIYDYELMPALSFLGAGDQFPIQKGKHKGKLVINYISKCKTWLKMHEEWEGGFKLEVESFTSRKALEKYPILYLAQTSLFVKEQLGRPNSFEITEHKGIRKVTMTYPDRGIGIWFSMQKNPFGLFLNNKLKKYTGDLSEIL